VLARGMAKDPADRWESAGAMVRALDDALTPPPRRRPPAAGAATTRLPSERSAPAAAPRRRWATGALIALGTLLLVVAGAVALLSGGGSDPQPEPPARQEPKATATPERTSTPEEPTATPTPTPSPQPTQAPAQDATPEPKQKPKKSGKGKSGSSGSSVAQLQLQAFNLNNAGRPDQALPLAQKAVELCKGSTDVTCAYALYEYARALRMTGNPEGAIAALEERKRRFPDNQPGAVEEELLRARAAAGEQD
jgi:hypothetical protein